MTRRVSCIFCAIVAGTAPASEVYRDALCCAFLDTQPLTPGHLLVIPLVHATDLTDLPPATGAHMFEIGQRLALSQRAALASCTGTNLILADGRDAGQTVFHVHLHVVPRSSTDGFGFRFPAGYPARPARASLDAQAALLRQSLPAAGS